MSIKINPWLVPSFVDDEPTKSVQGCYQGSDYWDVERQCDKSLRRDREFRQYAISLRDRLSEIPNEIREAEKRGFKRKLERLNKEKETLKDKLRELYPTMGWLLDNQEKL